MFKILPFLSLALITTLNTFSQVLPVEELKDNYIFENRGLLDDGITYVKDVNNKLDKFVGIWNGTFEGIDYKVKIDKYTKQNEDSNIRHDKLIMRYEMSTGSSIILSTIQLPNSNVLVNKGYYLNNDTSYMFIYLGEQRRCGQKGYIFVSLSNTNTMNFLYTRSGHALDGRLCPRPAEDVLPNGKRIILNKR